MDWPGSLRRAVLLVVVSGLAAIATGCGGSDEKKTPAAAPANTQTIRFQEPEDPGPRPFTEPADVEGSEEVDIEPTATASGPFGGTGSNKVCDRDLLIRFLKANPDRMREWARVVGIDPDYRTVSRYIAKLHPVTLKRDTQVTNHSFVDGRAVGFQSILQAGTAVLVDKYGRPVARCRCGNPLKEPVFVKEATCTNCPPKYRPPVYCKLWSDYTDYDKDTYDEDYYTNEDYDLVYIESARGGPYVDCYVVYPDPPPVRLFSIFREPPPEPEPEPEPQPDYTAPQQDYPPQHDPDYEDGTTGDTTGDTTGGDTTGDTTGGDTTGDTTGGDTTGGDTTGGTTG